MSNSSPPEEPSAPVRKIDNEEENESAKLPEQTATGEVPDTRDPLDADENVEGGATSKEGADNDDKRGEHAKACDSDQNKDNSSPSDKSKTEEPQRSTYLNPDDDSNVVKPGDVSNSPKSAPDAASLENTNEKDKEAGSMPSEVHAEPKERNESDVMSEVIKDSKQSEDIRLPEQNEVIDDVSKKEAQDQTGTTSKIEDTKTADVTTTGATTTDATTIDAKTADATTADATTADAKTADAKTTDDAKTADATTADATTADAKTTDAKTTDDQTTDAMQIDTQPAAPKSEEHACEGVKEVQKKQSSEEKEEMTHSAVEEMDIDSEHADDDANMKDAEQVEEEQNSVRGEPENPSAPENATKANAKHPLPEQTAQHNTEEGKSPECPTEHQPTGGGNDEEEDSEEDSEEDENEPKEKEEEMPIQTKASTPKEEDNTVRDSGENQITSQRPRRSSARNGYEHRSLRPRTSGRVNNSGTNLNSPRSDSASEEPQAVSGLSRARSTSTPNAEIDRLNDVNEENAPSPIMEANGLVMRIEEAVFVTKDQLDELKIARLTDKKVKPFEELTFQDLRTYNRDQLRAYCFAYGMARRKKTEMEADMARYLSYWNKGREGFALHDYVPTSSRVIERVEQNLADSIATAGPTTSAGSASQEGSATPSISNGKASGFATKSPSSQAATPIKGPGTAANSARLNTSQGSSAPSGGGSAGVPASTRNAMQPGSSQAGAHRITTTGSRTAKVGAGAPILPRGFGTSFKQKVHARHAGAKFKAAYNGAGPAIVNIVENAAAYFEGKDSPEVILDQGKSFERYQFNVDMLNEIFDGVPEDSDQSDGDVVMGERDGNALAVATAKNDSLAKTNTGNSNNDVLGTVADRVASGKRKAQVSELAVLEKQFREAEERTKHTERTNMRLFQRLERAETKEQVEAVKREFEAVHQITFDESIPPPLVRRKLDKSLPPIVMSDDKCRILRFKVS